MPFVKQIDSEADCRIEKGEMQMTRHVLLLKENIFDPSIESFETQAGEQGLEVINNIDPSIKVEVDAGLMQVVSNNLLNNAIKYGQKKGKVIITA